MVHFYTMPKNILDENGIYEFITLLYNTFDKTTNSKIILDFSSTNYINPNLMAPLGMILTKLKSKNNDIILRNLKTSVKQLLIKYGFLNSFNISKNTIHQNYIKYESFNGDDAIGFEKYLNLQLAEISNEGVISTLISHIMEIFVNVKTHARSNEKKSRFKNKEIFTSGYYNENKNYIRFSICNNGKSFSENISSKIKYYFNTEYEYINWALKEKNTTKNSSPGGLGLYMLSNLINICEGTLIILSGKGYYELSYSEDIGDFKSICKDFSSSFPGTVVTIKLPLILVPENKTVRDDITIDILSLLKGDI